MTDSERMEARIGEWVRRHAGLYHDPPPTPREAIWKRIEAERREAAGPPVVPITRGSRRRKAWATAFAAAAVLALGVALGRLSMERADEREAGVPVVAERPAPAAPESGPSIAEPVAPPGTIAQPDPAALAAADPAPAAAPVARRATPRPERRAPAARSTNLYRLASVQMLGQAEALLVEYRTGDRMDPAVGRWAKDVLSSTRLLLDSPAAADPAMRRLLEDLELVLAQIVQRAGGGDPLDDQMIEQTIEDRGLLPRLRGAIPAGGAAGA